MNAPNAALLSAALIEHKEGMNDQLEPASAIPTNGPRGGGGDGAWIVTYECESEQRAASDDELIERLADDLIDHLPMNSHPVVSAVGTAVHLTFQVIANASTAIPLGVEYAWTALEACGMSDYQITRAAQISLREHQRQSGAGHRHLHLLNASECARELEITRQRVGQLIDAGDFPEPVGMVGKRSVWFKSDIALFKIRRAGR